jgi:hypothetical protein
MEWWQVVLLVVVSGEALSWAYYGVRHWLKRKHQRLVIRCECGICQQARARCV